jgi:hypothetical protein
VLDEEAKMVQKGVMPEIGHEDDDKLEKVGLRCIGVS